MSFWNQFKQLMRDALTSFKWATSVGFGERCRGLSLTRVCQLIPPTDGSKKSLRHADISIWNTSAYVEPREQLLALHPPPPPPPPARGCLLQKRFKQERQIRPKRHKHHRSRSKLETEWKENQLCWNPLLTISAGEGAFFCFCRGWLFCEWRPRQPALVCLAYCLRCWLSTPQRGILTCSTRCSAGRETQNLGTQQQSCRLAGWLAKMSERQRNRPLSVSAASRGTSLSQPNVTRKHPVILWGRSLSSILIRTFAS